MEIILLIYAGILTAMLWLVIWRKNVWKQRHHTLQREGDEDMVSKVAIALGQSMIAGCPKPMIESRSQEWPDASTIESRLHEWPDEIGETEK